jgi:hypothetical protein
MTITYEEYGQKKELTGALLDGPITISYDHRNQCLVLEDREGNEVELPYGAVIHP